MKLSLNRKTGLAIGIFAIPVFFMSYLNIFGTRPVGFEEKMFSTESGYLNLSDLGLGKIPNSSVVIGFVDTDQAGEYNRYMNEFTRLNEAIHRIPQVELSLYQFGALCDNNCLTDSIKNVILERFKKFEITNELLISNLFLVDREGFFKGMYPIRDTREMNRVIIECGVLNKKYEK